MALLDLENMLQSANSRLKLALEAEQFSNSQEENTEYDEAYKDVIKAERQLAAFKEGQYAEPFGFPIKWDIGAPMPYLITNGSKAVITFFVSEPNQTMDDFGIALVEFHTCYSARLGSPNDEVINGHPLYGRGLEPYTAQIVRNSSWIAELKIINQVHSQYNPKRWEGLQHYIFWFHDDTFECVAQSYTVNIYHQPLASVLQIACGRLLC